MKSLKRNKCFLLFIIFILGGCDGKFNKILSDAFGKKEESFTLVCKWSEYRKFTFIIKNDVVKIGEEPDWESISDQVIFVSDDALRIKWRGSSKNFDDGRYGENVFDINRYTGTFSWQLINHFPKSDKDGPHSFTGDCEKILEKKF